MEKKCITLTLVNDYGEIVKPIILDLKNIEGAYGVGYSDIGVEITKVILKQQAKPLKVKEKFYNINGALERFNNIYKKERENE